MNWVGVSLLIAKASSLTLSRLPAVPSHYAATSANLTTTLQTIHLTLLPQLSVRTAIRLDILPKFTVNYIQVFCIKLICLKCQTLLEGLVYKDCYACYARNYGDYLSPNEAL